MKKSLPLHSLRPPMPKSLGAPARMTHRKQGPPLLSYALALAIVLVAPFSVRHGSSADFLQLLDEMERAYGQVDDYTATFLLQERVEDELKAVHLMALKFKKPFSVYLRWIDGPNKGRQALYPAGVDGNALWVRVPILLGAITLSLDPQSPRAKKGRRHPITDIGIGQLLDLIGGNARRALAHGELTVEDHGEQTTFDRSVDRYLLRLPPDVGKGYYCMTALIDVDREQRLPIYIEIFDWHNLLIERYGYLNLRLNPGLTNGDFDPKNPHYGF